MHIFNHSKATWKFSPPSKIALRLGRLPCFARLSFWYKQRVDGDGCGELVD
jgi:hypothetical protein